MEARFLCFMMKYFHSKKEADGSAKESEEKETSFRNSPLIFDCFSLVDAHGKKA